MKSKDYEEIVKYLREAIDKVDDAYNKLSDMSDDESDADSIYNAKEALIDAIKEHERNYRDAIRAEDFNGQFRRSSKQIDEEAIEQEVLRFEKQMPPIRNPNDEPTEKQMDFIRDIEEELGVDFMGKTKKDAQEWISEHIDEFYEMREDGLELSYDSLALQLIHEDSYGCR